MAKQLSPFEQAFKDARADNKKDFDFNGKKYNTKYKEENSAPVKKDVSNEDMSPTKANTVKVNGASTDSSRNTDALKITSLKNTSPTPKPKPKPKPTTTNNNNTDSSSSFFSNPKTRGKNTDVFSSSNSSEDTPDSGNPMGDYSGADNDITAEMPTKRNPRTGREMATFKKGGSVSSRADGIAQRGKTRGKIC